MGFVDEQVVLSRGEKFVDEKRPRDQKEKQSIAEFGLGRQGFGDTLNTDEFTLCNIVAIGHKGVIDLSWVDTTGDVGCSRAIVIIGH